MQLQRLGGVCGLHVPVRALTTGAHRRGGVLSVNELLDSWCPRSHRSHPDPGDRWDRHPVVWSHNRPDELGTSGWPMGVRATLRLVPRKTGAG